MRFCCPHCDQAYYGTDPQGRLTPSAFTCARCGVHVSMDEMIVRPLEGAGAFAGVGVGTAAMPWFERGRLGLARAWWQTMVKAMVRPQELIAAVPEQASATGALGFMAGHILLFTLVGALPAAIFTGVVMGTIAAVPGLGRFWMLWLQLGQLAVTTVLSLAGIVVWIGLTHWFLRLLGAATKPLLRTLHCICYSSPSAVLMAVPCGCPGGLGSVWWLISAVLMLVTAHRASAGRATAAAIIAGFLAMLVPIGGSLGYSLLTTGVFARVTVGGAGQIGGSVAATQRLAGAASAFRGAHGRWPVHGLELLGQRRQPADFAAGGALSGAVGTTPVFENLTLRDLEARPDEWTEIAERAAAGLPSDVVAHRVGDYLFLWHGFDGVSDDALLEPLWVVLQAPVNDPMAPNGVLWAVQADGTVVPIPRQALSVVLRQQNAQRELAGLPPLPADLESITEAAPARRSAAPE